MKKYGWLLCLFLLSNLTWAQQAKNAIWVVGDGMGPGAMGFFMEGVRLVELEQYPDQQSAMEKFINASTTGIFFNNTQETIVTDSACAATQMASGEYSLPEMAGTNAKGENVVSILEKAVQAGKAVGFVTDSYVADATPAGFLAHVADRNQKYEIARQIVQSQAQVVLGGGLQFFNQKENKDLLSQAEKKGWQVVQNIEELSLIKKGKVLGLFSPEAMPFYGEKEDHKKTPTLLEMTQKAVEILSQNEKGFILVVEAGKIDWALHDNEAGPTLWEMMSLDETLAYVWDFAQQKKDTLVYLNADHETGAPVFDYKNLSKRAVLRKTAQGERLYGGNTDYMAYDYYQRLFKHKRLLYYVYQEFKKLPKILRTSSKLQRMSNKAMGMKLDLKLEDDIPSYDDLIKKLNKAQGVAWATDTHSSAMVLGVAYGPGEEHFKGVYHNTDLKGKFEKVLGL